MAFDPLRAFDLAESLAFPRRVGTPGEDAARRAVAEHLNAAGYAVEEHPFECSTGTDLAFALLIALAQVLIVVTFWFYSGPAILALLPALALAALVIFASRVTRWAAAAVLDPATPLGGLLGRKGHHFTTANLYAHMPAADPAAPHLILMAHWDSKSQSLPLAVRMALLTLGGVASLVFAALTLVRIVWPPITSLAALCGLVALVLAVPVLLLYLTGSGNASPGAVDNASGLGLLLHLAEHFAAEPVGIGLTFLATGAEEFGLLGSTNYVQALRANGVLPAPNLHVLNLDGVGTSGGLAYVGAPAAPLAQQVRAAAATLGLRLRHLGLEGAMYDHLPFADAGIDAVSLVTTGRAAQLAHTPADNAGRLHPRGFEQVGLVVLQVVSQLEGE